MCGDYASTLILQEVCVVHWPWFVKPTPKLPEEEKRGFNPPEAKEEGSTHSTHKKIPFQYSQVGVVVVGDCGCVCWCVLFGVFGVGVGRRWSVGVCRLYQGVLQVPTL